MRLTVIVFSAALAVAGCVRPGAAPSSAPPERAATTLNQAEIEKNQYSNLYDAVRSLRPRWMQVRGADSFKSQTPIQVYVGGQHVNGGLDALREISATGVAKVEFYDAAQAQTRFGTGNNNGAILVTLATR